MSKQYRDKEWLEEKYVDERLTIKEIANLANCSTGTIHRWMKKKGISRRSIDEIQLNRYGKDKRYRNKNWLTDKYKDKNMTTFEIGELVGVSKTTIRRWLKKFDIEMRDNKPRYKKTKVKCDYCNNLIEKTPSAIEDGNHNFCSRDCFYDWKSEKFAGKNNPSWKERIEKECEYCNNTYKVVPSLAERSRFCSRECYCKWQSKNLNGKDSYHWKGGDEEYVNKRAEAPGSWQMNRRQALKRDKNSCEFCGSNENVDVHHILPVRNGGSNYVGNLISICRSCHSKLENEIEY